MSKAFRWILIGLVCIVVAGGFFVFMGGKKPAPVVLPSPNGYDSLLAAAKAGGDPGKYTEMSLTELEALVQREAKTYALVREGLSRESLVPIANPIEARMPDMASFKSLGHLIAAEGRLAELKNKPAEAAQSYLDMVRLGHAMSRGGLLIDSLHGISIEAIALNKLSDLRNKLPAAAAREVTVALEKVDARGEPGEVTLQTERAWARQSGRGRLALFFNSNLLKGAEDKFMQKRNQVDLQRRQLMVNLASQAYRGENGKDAASFGDLVPKYLKAIPNDPIRKGNLSLP